jgi:hypothetical protein
MAKKPAKTQKWSKKKIVIAFALLLVAVAIFFGGCFAHAKLTFYNATADQASIVSIRELILLAVRGVKKEAPVEPRTGDIYFPESRLYLPYPGTALPITYLFDTGDISNSQSELSVSTYPVRGTETLYSAQNMNQLFDAVPKLQACSRGIKLVYDKFPQSDTQNELKHAIKLNNGRNLYIYLEKDCPELRETADLFTNIRAY